MRIVCILIIMTIICGCRGVGEWFPDKSVKESVFMLSEGKPQQVFPRSVSGPSKDLYLALCSIRLPVFHVTKASAFDILKFVEDAYNDYSDPIWNHSVSPKPKQSIFDLAGMKSEVLAFKITRYIEDITLMHMLHEVCAEIDVDMGLLNGRIVFAERPKGVSASEMCQPHFWPGRKLPEAIITRNDQYAKSPDGAEGQ